MRPVRAALAGAAFCAAALVPAARAQELGQAVEGSYPTNLSMLTEAAESAVTKLFLGFNAPRGATLLVEPASDHEADWFVENLILRRLTDAGYSAYLKQEPTLGPPLPAGYADSTGGADSSAVDTAAAAVLEAPTGFQPASALPAPEYVLRYRVAEFGILYPHSYRKSPLGERHVQRLAAVSLFANLLKGRREDVVWTGNGDAQRLDVVPAGKLPLLEGKTFPFSKPTLQTKGLGSFVEPALVTGIVAGLIYLFYTNQN